MTYTEYENSVIRSLYPDGGAKAVCAVLEHRPYRSIQKQASRLGVAHRVTLEGGNRTETYHTAEVVGLHRAMREWRGPVSHEPLRWAA